MPMAAGFASRLDRMLPAIVDHFGTPCYIYDEQGIDESCALLNNAFAGLPFREYFAVKALPNPAVLGIMTAHGFGFDCSSIPELALAHRVGAAGHDIFFTSNNTSREELVAAVTHGALVNVDDMAILAKLGAIPRPLSVPDTLCLRVNPGRLGSGDDMLGDPRHAKFGIRADQLVDAGVMARDLGVRSLGLHMMLASNAIDPQPFRRVLDLLLDYAGWLHTKLNVQVELLNLGGGIGIPYRPGERRFDLAGLGALVRDRLTRWSADHGREMPRICLESGRYVTGPHGVLVTRVVNRMSKWREYVGVDAGLNAMMRPALYTSAYHHITAPLAEGRPREVVDVVGSLCENNDKLGVDRELPRLREGDVLLVHDVGAHAHPLASTYNGRLRPKELLLRADGTVDLIRRAEEVERDHLSTLAYTPDRLSIKSPTVAIVDPFTTGAHLPTHFRERGWRPVAVLSRENPPELWATSLRAADFDRVVVHRDVTRATASELGRLRVQAVIAGAEIGVEFADELAELLGLAGNGSWLSRTRRDKAAMVDRLREAGLRHAATFTAGTADEAAAAAERLGRWPVVVKPADSAGSDGVTFCASAAEVRRTFDKLFGRTNRMGLRNQKVLLQELLTGQQYFVNSVSRSGRHYICEIWQDNRRRVADAGLVCDWEDLLPAHGEIQDQLRTYVRQVLDALGIAWGPAHTELMLTTDGPVLIEAAARMQGTILPSVVDEATGASQVRLAVEAVTDPAAFDARLSDPYPLNRQLSVVSLIADRDGVIGSPDVQDRLAELPSFRGLIGDLSQGVPVRRTIDLFTSPGIVYLLADDAAQIERDRATIRALEAADLYR